MNPKTFCLNHQITYQECLVSHPALIKTYEINNPKCVEIKAIPDGCIDVQFLWIGNHCLQYICGSFSRSNTTPTGNYTKCFGVKFRPGIYPKYLGIPVHKALDQRFTCFDRASNAAMVRELEERIYCSQNFAERTQILLDGTKHLHLTPESDVVSGLIGEIEACHGCINVKDLADSYGYSQQHLNHLFKERVGVSIKRYANLVRVQNAFLIVQNNKNSDELYTQLGYYDQAHFINEFRLYSSTTPKKLQQAAGELFLW